MGKRPLITEKDVTAALQAGRKTLAVTPQTLITPLARDTAREQGLAFVDPPPEAAPSAKARPRTHVVVIGSSTH